MNMHNKRMLLVLITGMFSLNSFSSVSSFFKTMSHYVPVKTTMGIGFGMIGVCAYYAYALPAWQKRYKTLDKQKIAFGYVEYAFPSLAKNIKQEEIDVLVTLQAEIQGLRAKIFNLTSFDQHTWKKLQNTIHNKKKEFELNKEELIITIGLEKFRTKMQKIFEKSVHCSVREPYELAYESVHTIGANIKDFMDYGDNYTNRSSAFAKYLGDYDEKITQRIQQLKTDQKLLEEYRALERNISYQSWYKPLGLLGACLVTLTGIVQWQSLQASSKKLSHFWWSGAP